MEIGTAVSAVDSLNETLRTLESKEFLWMHGCKSQIGELLVTVPKLRALLLRGSGSGYLPEFSSPDPVILLELKDALFEANRVLEDILNRNQLLKNRGRGSFLKKLRLHCSRSNPRWVAYRISHIVQKIRNILGDYVDYDDYAPNTSMIILGHQRETFSYIGEADIIIGREDEVEKIVGMLDSSNVQCDLVSFLSIVGMGGLGKTALAQLVFNHPRIANAFPLRLWTCCVSDTIHSNQNLWYIGEILIKILESATGQNHMNSTMDQVQSQLQEQLASQRYLLVLDDVWTENHIQWDELVKYLVGGQKGSWILVTTRLKSTATMVGGAVYELQGLSKDNSWRLFERLAFTPDQLSKPLDDQLVMIGRNNIDKCAGVPLIIRYIGCQMHGHPIQRWRLFQALGVTTAITCFPGSEFDIMSTFKLSFQNLKSQLNSCFSYCALFPKGFEIEKEKLISLWMAQRYIFPSYEGQSIEDICEEYFSSLFSRFFFQDVKKDKFGQIMSCKIPDIMLDISRKVAGKEMCVMKASCSKIDKDVRHLSVWGEFDEYTLGETHILSYLHFCEDGFQVGKVKMPYLDSLVENCLSLKALDLSGLIFEKLPDNVSKLVQLRYLNISGNTEIEILPKSITKLHNLQTFMLRWCCTLKELPTDLSRLVDLRLLDIRGCSRLTYMPSSMGKLACLHSLSDYIVGGEQSYSSSSQWFDGLNELTPLNNLRGCLNIQIRWPEHVKYAVKEDGEQDGLCLGNKERLIAILFDFIHEEEVDERAGYEEAEVLMEKLHPHRNLKFLEVKNYHGLRMPGWVTLLPYLEELCLTNCRELEYLPCLRNLLCLKVLKLVNLAKLEWIGEDSPLVDSSSTPTPHQLSSTERLSYLPSLETIEMDNLPKLKGWRRGVGDDHQFFNDDSSNSSSSKAQLQSLPSSSGLKSLVIWNCPEMTSFSPCLKIEDLTLFNFNSRLQMNLGVAVIPYASCSSWSPHPENWTAVKKVTISNVSWLSSVPKEAFRSLESLDIRDDKELRSLGEATNVFRGCSSSLRHLIIRNCCNLSSVVLGGLKHLVALEELEIKDCNDLRLSEEQNEEGVECTDIDIKLMPRLTTLTLHNLPQLMSLPDWMQFLTALQSLDVSYCNQLRSMPNWMPKLQSLTHLTLSGCSYSLKRRCQENPPGKDRPYIEHIQNIYF